MSHAVTRRRFLSASAIAAGAAVAGSALVAGCAVAQRAGQATAEAGAPPRPLMPPVKIHRVYVGMRGQAWPKPEIDLKAEVARFEKHLAGVEGRLGDVKFVGGELVQNPQEAAAAVAASAEADAVLLVHLTLGTGGMLKQIIDAGLPTAIFAQPFSGHEWMHVRDWQRAGSRVVLVASSDLWDIDRAVALMRAPARMRQSRIILSGGAAGTAAAQSAEQVKKRLGAEVISVSVDEIVKVHQAIDLKMAEAEAQECWIRPAKKIVEPTREEIIKSARMYLAMKKIMVDRQAQAITIRCLGGIPIGILGYPCLGFSRLCDEGLVGACEADMDSTLTMLLFRYAFGVPGFITDPLFDTSKDALIHAHCTAPTRMDGFASPRAPFMIRTHRDDNRGASLEVEMRVGQPITCAKLVNLDTVLLSRGKIIEITDFDDRGCRTQITTEVADARRMIENWGGGVLQGDMMTQLHRVVFYGDRLRDVRDLAHLMGLRVVEEG
jgi:hypothetical protein